MNNNAVKLLIPGFAIAYQSSIEWIGEDGLKHAKGDWTLSPKMVQANDLPPELVQAIQDFLAAYEMKRRGLNIETTEVKWET